MTTAGRGASAALVLLAAAGLARAHGGLPVSQRIFRHGPGGALFVPVEFWGVWIGSDAGPWTWICEEEINPYRSRRMALSSDGTFYFTDIRGLTLSTDHGCTFVPAAGELNQLHASDVVADPADGATAYVTTADGGDILPDGGLRPAVNGLFVTRDHGASFARLGNLDPGRLYQSIRIAASDARTLYVSSTARFPPAMPAVQRSNDGGVSFTSLPLAYQLEGNPPPSLELLGVDPRDRNVVYARAAIEVIGDGGAIAKHALLRSIDGGSSFAEIWKMDGFTAPSGESRGIDGVAVDVGRGRLLVATSAGLLQAADPGGAPTVTLEPSGNLRQTQCVDVQGATVYACSSNFAPDNAAIARSDDGGATFRSIFRFVDTRGPIACPAGTPVGDNCPLYWRMYGSQLGINFPDGGVDGGGRPGRGGCSCGYGSRAGEAATRLSPSEARDRHRTPPLGLALLLAAAWSAVSWLRRRIRRPKGHPVSYS